MRNLFKSTMSLRLSLRNGIARHSRKFAIITVCNIAIQVISLMGFVFIARLYPVPEVGEYVTYIAYTAIISIISTGYYEQALFVERRARFARRLKTMPVVVSIVVSLACWIVLAILGVKFAFYIALSVISGGLTKTASNINITKNKLIWISMANLISAPLVPSLIILAAVLFVADADYMVAIQALSSFAISCIYYYVSVSREEIGKAASLKCWWLNNLALLRRYKGFAAYSMLGELAGTASARLPIMVATSFFEAAMAAFYGVALRVMLTPVAVLSSTISQIFLHKIYENKGNGVSSLRLFWMIFWSLFFLVGGILIVGFPFVEPIIVLLFTDKYLVVARIIELMLPYVFVLLVIAPMTSIFTVFEKQHYLFYNKLVQLGVSAIGFLVAAYLDDFMLGVMIFTGGMSLLHLVYLYQMIGVLKSHRLNGA